MRRAVAVAYHLPPGWDAAGIDACGRTSSSWIGSPKHSAASETSVLFKDGAALADVITSELVAGGASHGGGALGDSRVDCSRSETAYAAMQRSQRTRGRTSPVPISKMLVAPLASIAKVGSGGIARSARKLTGRLNIMRQVPPAMHVECMHRAQLEFALESAPDWLASK